MNISSDIQYEIMTKIYLDRNVNVRAIRTATTDAFGDIGIEFIQWPLEGKSKRIKKYGLPAGEILGSVKYIVSVNFLM